MLAGVFGLVGDILSTIPAWAVRHDVLSEPHRDQRRRGPPWRNAARRHPLVRSQQHAGTFGHWVGFSAHLVLGGSNIIWFEVFRRVQAEAQGVAVTAVHFLFVALNAFLIIRGGQNRVASSL
jgi:hypothetical protein